MRDIRLSYLAFPEKLSFRLRAGPTFKLRPECEASSALLRPPLKTALSPARRCHCRRAHVNMRGFGPSGRDSSENIVPVAKEEPPVLFVFSRTVCGQVGLAPPVSQTSLAKTPECETFLRTRVSRDIQQKCQSLHRLRQDALERLPWLQSAAQVR